MRALRSALCAALPQVRQVDRDAAWADEAHWVCLGGRRLAYHAPCDDRVLVPRWPLAVRLPARLVGGAPRTLRLRLGWTLNMARAASKAALGLLLAGACLAHRRGRGGGGGRGLGDLW